MVGTAGAAVIGPGVEVADVDAVAGPLDGVDVGLGVVVLVAPPNVVLVVCGGVAVVVAGVVVVVDVTAASGAITIVGGLIRIGIPICGQYWVTMRVVSCPGATAIVETVTKVPSVVQIRPL
jgi:hypothetical protein